MRNTLFKLILIAFALIGVESIGWLAMKWSDDHYFTVRQILLGKEKFVGKHYTVGQPYLLFIASPEMEKDGFVQHNEDGYRGKKVPLKKRDNHLRILFLGGSTTYSMWVTDPDSTYPALVGKILAQEIEKEGSALSNFNAVEVINAGVPWGSTAEILTHYHFKYRYYQPDLVVINTGGNDAYFVADDYQPDYSHFRKSAVDIAAAKPGLRWVYRSRLLSFILIKLVYDDFVKGGQFVHGGEYQKTRWFADSELKFEYMKDLKYNAYYQNLRKTTGDVLEDGAGLLLVPFLGNWQDEYFTDTILSTIHFHNNVLLELSQDSAIGYVPFHEEIISDKTMWMDDCHLNTAGTKLKAELVSQYIINHLEQQ